MVLALESQHKRSNAPSSGVMRWINHISVPLASVTITAKVPSSVFLFNWLTILELLQVSLGPPKENMSYVLSVTNTTASYWLLVKVYIPFDTK